MDSPNFIFEFSSYAVIYGIGIMTGMIMIAVLGRAAYWVFRPLFAVSRFIFRPVIRLLRRVKILRSTSAGTRPIRHAAIGAEATIRHAPGYLTEIEKALRLPDETDDDIADSTLGDESEEYDFKDEKEIIKKRGLFFKWIRIPGSYVPKRLTTSLTEDIAELYLAEARRFFSQKVSLQSNPRALYEDAEGAAIIVRFRNSDRRCFYALNELRKVINGNARTLVLLLGLLPVALLALAFFLFTAEFDWPGWLVVKSNTLLTTQIAVIGLAITTAMLMVLFQHSLYAQQQRQNTREFANFLARYLDRISDRYREATAIASRVTVGDETNSKKLAKDAQKWHKIMMWQPFRAFFIESFVRNVYFQINRNIAYYQLLALFIFLFVLSASFVLLFDVFRVFVDDPPTRLIPAIVGFFLAILYFFLVNIGVLGEELDQVDWLGYDNLNVSKQMDEVVGKYAEDVGFWKGRFER